MATGERRKGSRFLSELDEYYTARQKHVTPFAASSCPPNFIPGATKAKTSVNEIRTMSRKISSLCYRGVVVRLKESMMATEKGLMPAGLLAMAFPAPSQHTSCLEHKIEQILQRNSHLFTSTSPVTQDSRSDDGDIEEAENRLILESMKSRQRGCSLPTTSRDIGTLPVISYDDNAVAELGSFYGNKRNRRHSYPLIQDDTDTCPPRLRRFKNVLDASNVDSVARLRNFCRGMSYYGSSTSRSSLPEEASDQEYDDLHSDSIRNKPTLRRSLSEPQDALRSRTPEETIPVHSWQAEPLSDSNTECTATKEEGSKIVGDEIQSPVSKGRSKKAIVHRLKFSSKKKEESRIMTDNSRIISNTNKATLSQIQSTLRSKLPKTLQTTVKMGLSFDPVTVQQRDDRARECKNLTAMLIGKERSRSLPNSPSLLPRSERSKTINNVTAISSLMVVPPACETSGDVTTNEKAGRLENLLKLGKDTLSRQVERLNQKTRRELKSPSAADIEVLKPISDSHAKKLASVLGSEFKEMYAVHRSNSLPSIGNTRKKAILRPPPYARSTSELQNTSSDYHLPESIETQSSYDTLGSNSSSLHTSREVVQDNESTENDSSDGKSHTNGSQECITIITSNPEQEVFSSPQIVIFMPTRTVGGNVAIGEQKGSSSDDGNSVSSNDTEHEQHLEQQLTLSDNKKNALSGHNHLRIEKEYVLNKSKLLKTSKELMEESKLRHSKIRKSDKERNHVNETQNCFDVNENSTVRKPENSNGRCEYEGNRTILAQNLQSSIEEKVRMNENELKELDALLMELESFSF